MEHELVYLIEPDPRYSEALIHSLATRGLTCKSLPSIQAFCGDPRESLVSCLLLDMDVTRHEELQLQEELERYGITTPVIFTASDADIAMCVRAMKMGAVDVLLKPIDEEKLISAVILALARDSKAKQRRQLTLELRTRFESLSPRERQALPFIIGGYLNKQTAACLGIAEVTLQVHRAQIMRKTRAQSLADLVRMSARLGIRHHPNANACDSHFTRTPIV